MTKQLRAVREWVAEKIILAWLGALILLAWRAGKKPQKPSGTSSSSHSTPPASVSSDAEADTWDLYDVFPCDGEDH